MEMTHNRAPYALPALLVGIIALVWALFLGGMLAGLLGVGAAMLGGMAYADTRSHGFDGAEMALIGAALGIVAVVLMFVGFAVM